MVWVLGWEDLGKLARRQNTGKMSYSMLKWKVHLEEFLYVSLEVRNLARDSVSSTFHYCKIPQDNFILWMVGFASRVYGWKYLKSLLLSAFQVCLCIGLVVCLFVCLFVCLCHSEWVLLISDSTTYKLNPLVV